MSSSPGAGYKLRPNKAVDRELFLSFLSHFSAILDLKNYKYIGLGGAFLEDFRQIHAKIGITQMSCIDADPEVSKRQSFNKPISSIECIHSRLEDYLDSIEYEEPTILWLDYTAPKEISSQLGEFERQLANLPDKSILRITLNANPGSLGSPSKEDRDALLPECESEDHPAEAAKLWRLKEFEHRLGVYSPADLTFSDMSQANYGKSILKTLHLIIEKARLEVHRTFEWGLATDYADGQNMVTATIFISDDIDEGFKKLLGKWEYVCDYSNPHTLNMPALSTRERLHLEYGPEATLSYSLETENKAHDPIKTFRKYYRVFPHFSRVEL